MHFEFGPNKFDPNEAFMVTFPTGGGFTASAPDESLDYFNHSRVVSPGMWDNLIDGIIELSLIPMAQDPTGTPGYWGTYNPAPVIDVADVSITIVGGWDSHGVPDGGFTGILLCVGVVSLFVFKDCLKVLL